MLFELLNSISLTSFTNELINYTLLTGAFFSLFMLVTKVKGLINETKLKRTVSLYK